MGSYFSKPNSSDNLSQFDTDTENDPEYCSGRRDDSNMALKIFSSQKKQTRIKSDQVMDGILQDCLDVDMEKIMEIENKLDFLDKVSLVFLLYDDTCSTTALQYLTQIEQGAKINILQEWFLYEKKKEYWKVKLIEALSIIQNFQALKILGVKKLTAINSYYRANTDFSLCVDLFRKRLYLISDTLTESDKSKFLSIIKQDFNERNLSFISYNQLYLEMTFLYWITVNYIGKHNTSIVSRALKSLNLPDLAKIMEENDAIEENSICSTAAEKRSETASSLSTYSSANSYIQQDKINNSYVINPQHAGICLIINQEHFYKEHDKKFTHLLPNSKEKNLENREGTNLDKEKLKHTFEQFGYKIIVANNVNHFDMERKITDSMDEIGPEDGSLIVCILSHGTIGQIYGVNSIPVEVKEIQHWMLTKNYQHLKGKPKVLILQSCQGLVCQEVLNEHQSYSQMCLDGPLGNIPYTVDMLTFYATVPGFGAIRDKKNGSWMIQTLCNIILEKYREKHFDEICTLVLQKVSNKKWITKSSTRTMVPIKESTFSKFLYFYKKE